MLLRDGDVLLGCARVLDDGDGWRIGRVVLAPRRPRPRARRRPGPAGASRGRPTATCVLDAQTPLAGWYATFGFVVDGPEFLEDGIPHTPMRLSR